MDVRLWPSFIFRKDVQRLPKEVRMTMVELAACIAQGEQEPDGFMGEGIPAWINQPLEVTLHEIGILVEAGFLARDEERNGWHFVGWLRRIIEPRPGDAAYESPSWGQQPIARYKAFRQSARDRQAKYRAGLKAAAEGLNVDPATGEISDQQSATPPF